MKKYALQIEYERETAPGIFEEFVYSLGPFYNMDEVADSLVTCISFIREKGGSITLIDLQKTDKTKNRLSW